MVASPLPTRPKFVFVAVSVIAMLLIALLACARSVAPAAAPWNVSNPASDRTTPLPTVVPTYYSVVPVMNNPGGPALTPTPDPPHEVPPLRTQPEEYVVRAGDTLGEIARNYNISLQAVIAANSLPNPNILEIGQVVLIPPPEPLATGPNFKIIPNSELVNGPAAAHFDIEEFVESRGGYLAHYTEELEGATYSGAEVVERVSFEYSVNPRLLLAALEYQSGWVTNPDPPESTLDYPMGRVESWRDGLYLQLGWAANQLNLGYYLWQISAVPGWSLGDGNIVPPAPTINAGTAGVQQLFSSLYGHEGWLKAVGENGLFATYNTFFGYPFNYAIEPLLPPGLYQPLMQLPFEEDKVWAYTGGPHGGWASGSGWAAIDFAPPSERLGCTTSDEWVVAVADGTILRSRNGFVLQDLDMPGIPNDGVEQTGWTVLYMHIESRDRVAVGTYVRAGERIGHPSCEGGVSTGTHLHLARRFNGEWIPADQTMPFVLDGWVSRSAGREYDGYLLKDGQTVEALEGRYPQNAIHR